MRTILSTTTDVVIVAEASSGDEVQRLCREHQPDVLLMDLNMPGPPAIDTIAVLRRDCRQTRVVVLTAYDDEAYVRGLIMAGVAGYVLKDEAIETLIRAIRTASQGDTWFSRAIMARLVQQTASPAPSESIGLTEREQQILRLIALGWDNAHIASTLHLAEQTVRNYVSRLYVTIGLHSRAEVIVWAREQGMGGR